MMNIITLPKNTKREVFTVKSEGNYYAVVTGTDYFYVSPTLFDSPLKAANFGRSLQKKLNLKIKTNKKTDSASKKGKIVTKKRLYTEAEMASETKLKFREVWIILGPNGDYATSIIKDNTVVNYVRDRELAQTFKTYEDAVMHLKTLDTVIRRGHQLQRFFQPRE